MNERWKQNKAHYLSLAEDLADGCPAEIWCSYNKYLPEKRSFEGKYASFKNIRLSDR